MTIHKIKGQGVIYLLVVVALMALIFLWLSQKPESIQDTQKIQPEATPTPTQTAIPPTPQSINTLKTELQSLEKAETQILESINDVQLNIEE